MQRDWLASATLGLAALVGAYVGLQSALNVERLAERWGALAWPSVGASLGGSALAATLVVRGRIGTGGATVGAAIAVGLAWIAVQHFFCQPYQRLVVEASLGLACAVFALLRLPALRATLRFPRPLLRLALALASVLIALELGLEVLARARPYPLWTTAADTPARKVASQRFRPGALRLGQRCNARGFYDDPFAPPARRRAPTIAFVGDSFVAGVVPHPFGLDATLEQRLDGPSVLNLGVPGVGPDAYAWLVEHEARPLEPDLILVGMFVGNDLTDAAYRVGIEGLLRRLLDEERLRAHAVLDRALALRRAGLPILGARRADPGPDLTDQPAETVAAAFPWIFDHRLEQPTFSEDGYLDLIRERSVAACRPDDHLLRDLATQLDRIRARAGPIPLALVLFPTEFQVEDGLWGVAERRLAAGGAPFDRTAAQTAIRALAAERDLPLLDLYPVLRAQPSLADGDRHLFHLRDSHLNARGTSVAASAVADFIRAQIKPPR